MTKTISERIYELRKGQNLTQEQLGALLGISGQAVSKWEKGESLPDILLLPELCRILGVSADRLLGTSIGTRQSNIMQDLCEIARENGKSATVIEAMSCMWHDNGKNVQENFVDFGDGYIRVYDKKRMSFAVNGNIYLKECLEGDVEEITYITRILADEKLLKVLSLISLSEAITRCEIAEATGLDEDSINRILTGFFKRGMIVCEKDKNGKRGYMQGETMAGIYMILAGCKLLSENSCMVRFSRNDERQ